MAQQAQKVGGRRGDWLELELVRRRRKPWAWCRAPVTFWGTLGLVLMPQVVLLAAPRRAARPPTAMATPTTNNKLQDAPIEFRCDNMSVLSRPNRNICRRNVVIRRGDLLVCCERFEGTADDAWQWQRFECHQGVRAQRGADTMWAEDAVFFAGGSDLVLTGHPMLKRGDSLLEGERVTLDMQEDRAHIVRPKGRLIRLPAVEPGPNHPPVSEAVPVGPLPGRCPIAPLAG